jgi:uncharacterized membrane protein
MANDGDNDLIPSEGEPPQLPPELIEVAREVGEEKVRRILAIHAERHSGPLPHPKLFAQYGEALKDAPERILRMAEKQQEMAERDQAHNHAVGMKMLDGDERRANWGLFLGFLLFVVVFGGAVYLIAIGFESAGYASLGALALSGIVNFIRVGRERNPPNDKNG